jgi:prolyl oligopeptidase
MPTPLVYPTVRRDESIVDVLHGVSVPDPYRHLEDPDAPETVAFCKAQNDVTQQYISRASHFREGVKNSCNKLLDYDKYSVTWREGSMYYYTHHVGLAAQAVVMQSKTLEGDDAVVFIDPNKLTEDGTASLGATSWSEDGRYCAYGVNRSGSDWVDIYVKDADTHEVLSEELCWAKFTSIAWVHDSVKPGFYYCRYASPDSLKDSDNANKGTETDAATNQQVYFHAVGTSQDEDRLVFAADPEFPERMFGLNVSSDGKYLMITVSKDCAPQHLYWYVDISMHLGAESENIVRLVDEFEASFSYVSNEASILTLKTNLDAPRSKIISIDLSNPARDNWVEIVPEHASNVLSSCRAVNHNQLALVYMRDASEYLSLHSLKTGELIIDLPLPDLGEVSLWGRRKEEFLMFKFTSWLYPGTIYYLDLNLPVDDGLRVFRTMQPPGFDPSMYQTRQVFYKSKDGTSVPMFIIGPKGDASTKEVAERPTLLYGYGGFSVALTPYYSARFVAWMQAFAEGGTVCVANLRGGSEYGEEWHEAGIKQYKQNVFDDFQWAAKALVEDLKIAVAHKIVINGGSNGGLLVGACVNQEPALWGAAVAQVGVLDMLRFHKFTIGSAWQSDYGRPDDEDEFRELFKYSPLHNVFSPAERKIAYPAILLLTGSHDDRVVPLHSLKFAAMLQHQVSKPEDAAVQGDAPILLSVSFKAGHGAGKPLAKQVDDIADTITFAALALNVSSASACNDKHTKEIVAPSVA